MIQRRTPTTDQWPHLMRQLLDSEASHAKTSSSPRRGIDDVVSLAAHALELHAAQALRTRATAERWSAEGRVGPAATPRSVPLVRSATPAATSAGGQMDRKG